MKKIERPLDIEKVGIMMHLAQFLLTQADDILCNILIAPERATPSPIHERMSKAHGFVKQALDAFSHPRKKSTDREQPVMPSP